jgi:aspartyl-tRNA(Asn)/glutamyl-tRNA(Gln) amidotransferase subunit A
MHYGKGQPAVQAERLSNAVLYAVLRRDDPSVQSFATGREADLHAVGAGRGAGQGEQPKSAFAGYFRKDDVLLCPVNPFTAPRRAQDEVVVNGVKVSAYT